MWHGDVVDVNVDEMLGSYCYRYYYCYCYMITSPGVADFGARQVGIRANRVM